MIFFNVHVQIDPQEAKNMMKPVEPIVVHWT